MAIHYNALYNDLLQDLSDWLPGDALLMNEDQIQDIEPWPDITLEQFRALMLAKSFFKKLEDRTNAKADAAALEKFLQTNMECKYWLLDLDYTASEQQLLGTFKKHVYNFYWKDGLTSILPDFSDIYDAGGVGPGSSIGAHGNDFFTKLFSSPLSTTSMGLYSAYEHNCQKVPNWADAEKHRYAEFGEPTVVTGNRLSFVPKNHNISRGICTEPTLNMFFQLGVGRHIEKRLSQYFGIRLASQPDFNRALAWEGSIDGQYSTIDLSCASDSMSWSMLQHVLPPGFAGWLDLFRSPSVTLPDGRVVELNMVSSMGNGFTFPLQTFIFSCVVSAVYEELGIKLRRNLHPASHVSNMTEGCHHLDPRNIEVGKVGNWGVFGDDIIVETRAYDLTVRLLNLLGFKINAEKSFSEGWFRESCGGDFFKGHQSRGVYLKSLKTPASRYVAINRLNEWTAITGIPLKRTVRRLVKSVRYLPVPLAENDDAGIKIPSDLLPDYIDIKKNRTLYVDTHTKSIAYRVWASRPVKIKLSEGEIRPPKGARKRLYNAPGLLEAFLRGDINRGTLSIRMGAPRYTAKMALTPNWDYVPTVGKQFPIGQAPFAMAIRTNMNS
jgi:hypothetical protein